MPESSTPLPPGQRRRLSMPPGSADALALAHLASDCRLLVLTESAQAAVRIADEAKWFAPHLTVRLFPDWETLPYDPISPHPDLVSERLETLWQASQGRIDLLVAPAATATQRLAPPEFLAAHAFLLKLGERLDTNALRERLIRAGYSCVNQVLSPGEFAVRGGLIDLYPTGAALPFRIELLDDEVESLRTFDPDTQRTLYKVNEIRLLPAREFPQDEAGITRFRQNFRDRFEGDPSKSGIYRDVSNKLAPAGVEYYLPLFFEHTATLFDYLPQELTVVLHGDVQRAVEGFWADTRSRYRLLGGDRERPLLPPESLFLAPDAFYARIRPYGRLEFRAADATKNLGLRPDLQPEAQDGSTYAPPPEVAVDRRAADPYARLKAHLAAFEGTTLLVAESLGRREIIAQALAEHGLKPELMEGWTISPEREVTASHPTPLTPHRFVLTTGPLAAGFIDTKARLAVLTETELYARSPATRVSRAARPTQVEGLLRDLSELKIGDPVVHVQHGIGRYLGLAGMDLGEGTEEFLTLEYAGGDRLYVPVAHLHLISRYMGGDPETAPLHRLGSGQWEKAKRRAMEKARDTAAELLNLYAQRAARQGHAFEFNSRDLEAFAEGFGFEETPDQLGAIEAVLADMRSGRPMDRLVCGDVGFEIGRAHV